MLTVDHIVIATQSLDDGITYAENILGIELQPGGQHPAFGTHNRLLGFADGVYMEVIAIEPGTVPGRKRWFGLDDFDGTPRLITWVARSSDLAVDAAHAFGPEAQMINLERNGLKWTMGLPAETDQPFDGLCPLLISWQGETAADRLGDCGASLDRISIGHPDVEALRQSLAGLNDDRVLIEPADAPRINAELTVKGRRITL